MSFSPLVTCAVICPGHVTNGPSSPSHQEQSVAVEWQEAPFYPPQQNWCLTSALSVLGIEGHSHCLRLAQHWLERLGLLPELTNPEYPQMGCSFCSIKTAQYPKAVLSPVQLCHSGKVSLGETTLTALLDCSL